MAEQIINHDLRVVNGRTLYMPPWEADNDKWGNLALPDVYAIGTDQQYPTGTIYRLGMRTFIYTKTDPTWFGGSGGAGIGAGYLMESTSEVLCLTDKVISGVAGANTLVVDLVTTKAANAYAGGFIGIKMAAGGIGTVGRYSTYQIISSTVANVGNSYHSTITIDGTLVLTLTTTDDVVLAENPYAEVRGPQTANYNMCVGALLCTTVASSYLWLQTGGPHNIMPQILAFEGASANEIVVYSLAGVPQVQGSGVSGSTTLSSIDVGNLQRIGYVYASSDIGGPGGTPANTTIAIPVFLTIFN